MAHDLVPIPYDMAEIAGIPVRPDSRAVVRKAIKEKRPVQVTSGNDYINLYHVFERAQKADKTAARCEVTRQQIGTEKWLVWFLPKGAKPPQAELDEGYDPKRGRYKRYAEQLANGERIVLDSKAEATKARRAWQLYVRKEKREHLRSTVRPVPRTGKWAVQILERDILP